MKKFTKLIPRKWIIVICMNVMIVQLSTVLAQATPQDGNDFNIGPYKIHSGASVIQNQAAKPKVNTNEADKKAAQNAFGNQDIDLDEGAVDFNSPDMLIYRPGATKPSNANTTGENTPSSSNDNSNSGDSNSNVTSNSPSPSPTNTPTPTPNPPNKAATSADKNKVAVDTAIPGPYCEKGLKHKKKPSGDPTYMDNEQLFPGSGGLNNCEKISLGHMKNLYKNGRRNSELIDWKDHFDFLCKDSCSDATEFNECVSKKTKQAKSCESIAYLISAYGRDWNDSEHNQGDPKGTTSTTTGITCKSAGVETLDYEPCMKFAKNIDTIEAVQQIGQGTQQMIYQDKMIDAQSKYVNEANAATGALKGQKDSIEMQQEMYQQRTAVDAAKLALLMSAYQGMPNFEDVVGHCNSMPPSEINGNPVTREDCKTAARAGQSNFALLQNEKETEKMKTKMIAVATQAGSSALLASLLGKRADDISKAIAKIDSFVPLDPLAPVQDDLTSTFCKQNPVLPECLGAGLDKTYDPLADNIITFGEGGLGTSYGTPNTNSDGSNSNGISDSPTARESVGSVGSVVSAAVQDDSIEDSTAATVSSGAVGSSGGGGGGSGGGVGGGGGGGPLGTGTPGGTQAAVQGKTPTYAGGAGSLSMMGGFGIKSKAANGKEENPFGKLFGKDGAKTSVVNFRDIASQKVGDKGDNLFDMISKRYTTVNADKRLIEYELAK